MKRTSGGGGGRGDGLTQGEIIQVQGGHIIRATGRKDRHSKVYTSKGPRDRRVRLSAHTAIQFYDVQDRLGCDRPSKAVDWLIKKAKNAIDKLDELPQHNPNSNEIAMAAAQSTDSDPGSTEPSSSVYAIQQSHLHENSDGIIRPLETQSISDTMKSFFPVSQGNSLMSMQGFPIERMPTQHHQQITTEDLGLSLHTFQDHQNLSHHNRNYSTEQMLFSGSNPGMFDESYHQKNESWGGGNVGESRIGSIFNPHLFPQQLFFSQSSSSASAFSHQREPLQSNYSNLINQAWNAEQRLMPSVDQHHHSTQAINQPSSLYNFHFGSDFQVPARIRGEEEPGVGVVSHQPPSVSPSSQH